MIELEFSPMNESMYEICYQALMLADRPLNNRERRDMGRLLDKFEAIGHESELEIAGVRMYDLKPDKGGIVPLERAEFVLLRDCIDKTNWKPVAVRRVNATLDWLDKQGEGR